MQKKGRTKKWTPCGIFSKRTQNPSRILGLFFGFPRNPLFSKSHFHHTKYTVLMIQPFLIKKKLHDYDRALFNPGLVVLVYIYGWLSKCWFLDWVLIPRFHWGPLHKYLVGSPNLHFIKIHQQLTFVWEAQ